MNSLKFCLKRPAILSTYYVCHHPVETGVIKQLRLVSLSRISAKYIHDIRRYRTDRHFTIEPYFGSDESSVSRVSDI